MISSEIQLPNEIFIFTITFLVSFIGTNTGGTAFMTIPFLVFYGLPPHVSIATTKVSNFIIMCTSLYKYKKANLVNLKLAYFIALCTSCGTYFGTRLLLTIGNKLSLKDIEIITFFMLTLLYFLSFLKTKINIKLPKIYLNTIGALLLVLAGFVGGFFAGQSIFVTIILTLFFHTSFLEAAGLKKISGIIGALISIVTLSTIIDWYYASLLAIPSALGAHYGASYGIKKGEKWIKKIFLVVYIIFSIHFIYFNIKT